MTTSSKYPNFCYLFVLLAVATLYPSFSIVAPNDLKSTTLDEYGGSTNASQTGPLPLSSIMIPLQSVGVNLKIKIKVNGVNFSMILDTGSSDTFVKGTKLNVTSNQKFIKQLEDNDKIIILDYLDGTLKTFQRILQVQFAQKKFNTSILISVAGDAKVYRIQGVIGLSFPETASHHPTFIQSLIENNLISKYAYGLSLNLVKKQKSYITFGQPNPYCFDGQIQYFPMANLRFLVLNIKSASFGKGVQVKLSRALMDTGNTCMTFPNRFQVQILSAFNTYSNRCIFQPQKSDLSFSLLLCRIQDFEQLPTVTLNIGGKLFPVEKQYYLHKCVQNPKEYNPNIWFCSLLIETTKRNLNDLTILGVSFFNRYYAYFDLQDKRIGIAKNRQTITLTQLQNSNRKWDQEDWKNLLQPEMFYSYY